MGFQIHDDLLEITADTETMGKSLGSDIFEGKQTIMVILAKESYPDEWKDLLNLSETNDLIKNIYYFFEEKNIINETRSISDAYFQESLNFLKKLDGVNTQELAQLVNFIEKTLPEARINFVSEELANQGFTPSVFSLDLPSQGNTDEERELYKRDLNLKLINLMIENIPEESKHCVSYGQLKGCYWTVPATSTQGTTKEGDKDYIARVALSPKIDLERHKEVFLDFVKGL